MFVDNTELKAGTDALGYRASPQLDDRIRDDDGADWGTTVNGSLTQDGKWFATAGWEAGRRTHDGKFLPVFLDGKRVLTKVAKGRLLGSTRFVALVSKDRESKICLGHLGKVHDVLKPSRALSSSISFTLAPPEPPKSRHTIVIRETTDRKLRKSVGVKAKQSKPRI